MFKVSRVTVYTLLLTLKINIACGSLLRQLLINAQYISFQVENYKVTDLQVYFEKVVQGYEILTTKEHLVFIILLSFLFDLPSNLQCVLIYIYIYIYIYTCMYIYAYVYICINLYRYTLAQEQVRKRFLISFQVFKSCIGHV